MEKTLISIIGPTGIGKTQLAISLARHFETEIISADSRQFYREMNIGTAVPSKEELSLAKHHFIQHKSIFDSYSVGDFERDAIRLLEKLFKKNDIIFMVGGSGLYIDAVTKGLDEFPEIDPNIRKQLNNELAARGISALQEELKKRDTVYYAKVDLENPHRLIRALEICIGTGRPYSSYLSKKKKPRTFKTISIGLDADRTLIYDRINTRVDRMIEQGLIEEAKNLERHKELNALQTVGYKELFTYFANKRRPPERQDGLNLAIEEIKKNTRRFAKRQMTWFKKDADTLWMPYCSDINQVISTLENKFDERN